MKLPKSVVLAGKTYKIILDPDISGGKFSCSKQEIRIGSKYSEEYTLEIVLHEILEALLAERSLRYSRYNGSENGDYLFSFNHVEFENIVKDLVLALKDFLKK